MLTWNEEKNMTKNNSPLRSAVLLISAFLLPCGHAAQAADAAGDTMRVVASKYKGAAVTLAVVIRTSGTGLGNVDNTEVEVSGVVIDPSGLVVTTNTAIDPASTFAGMDSELAGKMTTKVISARILVPNGDDIPAKVVLRDSDRNLAFLRPIAAPKSPLPFVDLKAAGKAQIGDPVFLLSRTGPVGNRSPQTTMIRIVSVLERPRTVYLLDTLGLQGIGNWPLTSRRSRWGWSRCGWDRAESGARSARVKMCCLLWFPPPMLPRRPPKPRRHRR